MVVINHPSKDKRYENLFALSILWELLLVLLVLFLASTVHSEIRNDHEHKCAPCLGERDESDPCKTFPHVVGNSDDAEAASLRDATLVGAWLAKTSCDAVAAEV